MRRFIYITLAIMWLISCQKESLSNSSSVGGAPIYLSAITEHSTDTRAPYEYISPNDGENGVLRAAIWASSFGKDNTGYTYPNPATPLNGKNGTEGDEHQVAIHATADFDSSAPQLLNQAVYPMVGTTVFFVGLHPQSGWSVVNDNKANFTFDGSNDVMFAPRIKGQYAQSDDQVINAPLLHFHHLLTWLKVRIKAEDADAISAWGKITKMEILSNTKVEIDLSDMKQSASAEVSDGVFDSSKCTFSTPGKLSLYKAGSDDEFVTPTNGYTMSTTSPQNIVAYVLCSPVDAVATKVVDGKDVTAPEYTLYIETENRRVELPIDLKKNANEYYTGNTRGKHFTLNLTFKIGNTIIVTARADDWEFGGTGNVEL